MEEKKNPLVGEKYNFVSAWDTNMIAFHDTRVRSEVEIEEDRIKISTKPKRFNKVPVILLEDILLVDMSTGISWYTWFWIIVSVWLVFATSNILWLIGTAIIIAAGLNRKIRIVHRNGENIIIYSRDKDAAEKFISDIAGIIK